MSKLWGPRFLTNRHLPIFTSASLPLKTEAFFYYRPPSPLHNQTHHVDSGHAWICLLIVRERRRTFFDPCRCDNVAAMQPSCCLFFVFHSTVFQMFSNSFPSARSPVAPITRKVARRCGELNYFDHQRIYAQRTSCLPRALHFILRPWIARNEWEREATYVVQSASCNRRRRHIPEAVSARV